MTLAGIDRLVEPGDRFVHMAERNVHHPEVHGPILSFSYELTAGCDGRAA